MLEEKIEINDFAQRILFGNTLEDKLFAPNLSRFKDDAQALALAQIPSLPHRPKELSFADNVLGQKANRPSFEALSQPLTRATFLHTFANHELLALELMAFALLRFPDAPRGFRIGLVQVILDEQRHFTAYRNRVEALGLYFGAVSVNSFFWRCVAHAPTIHDFNARLSLIFEQANLDFCRYYQPLFQELGDQQSAAVLEMIYQDEVKHVKYGLHWFRQWKNPQEEDWQSLKQMIEAPLTMARAKGNVFSVKAREEVGFDQSFIESLEAFGGSLGRPPVLWWGNFHAEDEIDAFLSSNRLSMEDLEPAQLQNQEREETQQWAVKGLDHQKKHLKRGNVQLKKSAGALVEDLLPLLGWLVKRGDVVLCHNAPSLAFQRSLIQFLGYGAEWIEEAHQDQLLERKIGGFSPWGWTDQSDFIFKPFQKSLIPSALPPFEWQAHWSKLYSKAFAVRQRECLEKAFKSQEPNIYPFLCFGAGWICHSWTAFSSAMLEIFKTHTCLVMKVLYAQAGRGQFRLHRDELINGEMPRSKKGWIDKQLSKIGLVVEPWWHRVADLSFHGHCEGKTVYFDGICASLVDQKGVYRGTWVGSYINGFTGELKRFLLENQLLSKVGKRTIEEVGQALSAEGYQGVFGIDVMVVMQENRYLLYPLVEINPRWTMGRVALNLKKYLSSQDLGLLWLSTDQQELAQQSTNYHQHQGHFLEGTYLLNDFNRIHQTYAFLTIAKKREIILQQIETILK